MGLCVVSCAKTAEPIEIGLMLSRVGPCNMCYMGM